MPPQNTSRGSKGMVDCASVAIPTVDGDSAQDARSGTAPHTERDEHTASAIHRGGAPHPETHQADGMSLVRQQLRDRGISAAGTDILMASWRGSTAKQYRPHINRWLQSCNRWHINPLTPTVTDIVNFLSDTFHRGVGYDSVNTARGALSSLGIVVDGYRAGNHPLVSRFFRRVFNLRPSTPRYAETWDVQLVLHQLRTMEPLCSLSLKELTLKLAMLMALTQAARVQTLHLLLLGDIRIRQDYICVWLGGNIKQCRPKFNVRAVTFKAYAKDCRLCVCETLKMYITRTEQLRSGLDKETGTLLISFIKPHKPVTKDTIARWLREVLRMSGVDTEKYSAGSVRPAAASKAKAMAVPITHIMAKAGWSKEATFAKYYDKEIVPERDVFQEAVLQ
ncbi:uncharacterized protein LOC126992159 [Eriocheir sinensis]|uniref:uncharacterized protein LOC126992159 n=1 Tax=Eriocheir sinensis TaxID=95602 RepID=UPI0021C6AECF|nr:uncharacterized protein LOC126992159 [Eriocheir sinensis]